MSLEIVHGAAKAVITETGAGLQAFEVDGVPFSETYGYGETPPFGSGAVLVPWPNRTAGAQWHLNGELQQLDVSEPARGNAIHGLVRRLQWTVVEHVASSISLEVEIEPQAGWPVRLRTTISYSLDDTGLTVTHGVYNVGDRATPFGVGTHPYPRAGNNATDDCTLRLAATTVVSLDSARMVPDGPAVPVAGTEYDFLTARPLRDVHLDTPFGGCLPGEDGLVRHVLTGPSGGVELWADPDFKWVQVFTPGEFPGRGRAIAIEPMTCPPDALNSGIDLIVVEPGQSWAGRWGITPIRT
ncbi:aldose 1-epimerase family protein [Kibdelosporangium philippinense]|uniref:Aldose 1-epimerase family protein n=1 Tax=Kibdelosporangium philippinense TaxID=211113 RepID=A0ABS8ZN30_9PSEU|nr:aldose 1-epimerase family protein [Kibdelosporangium philippinense]MCE7008987.1 aldose 1-epimerase family protein [Kibdelosporangium philippinense]